MIVLPSAMCPIEVAQGESRAAMAALPPASVDAIICDPPYEIGFDGSAWDKTGVAFDVRTWQAALRVLRPGRYLVAFGASRAYHRLAVAIEDAGFEVRDSLMWLYATGYPKGKACLKPGYEPAVVARRPGPDVFPLGVDDATRAAGGRYPANVAHDGSPEVAAAVRAWGDGSADFYYCAKPAAGERGAYNLHKTVKPVALMRWLIRLFSPPGGTVLDPFVGSGTTPVAAMHEGRRCLGIDLDAAHVEIARRRVRDAMAALRPPGPR